MRAKILKYIFVRQQLDSQMKDETKGLKVLVSVARIWNSQTHFNFQRRTGCIHIL